MLDERVFVGAGADAAIGDPAAGVAVDAVVDFPNEVDAEIELTGAKGLGAFGGESVVGRGSGTGLGAE